MTTRKSVFLAALLATTFQLGATRAEASPITLTLEALSAAGVVTATRTVVDGGAGDMNSLVDSLMATGTFGQFNFFSSTGNAVLQPDNLARLSMSAANVSNSISKQSGSLRITLTNGNLTTPYGGPAEALAAVAGSLTPGTGATMSVSVRSWVEGSAIGSTVNVLDPAAATSARGAFAFTDSAAINLDPTGTFALTTQALITFNGVGTASLTYSDLKILPVAPVPEPGSLLLFGSGLLGLATVIRRKRKAAGQA